MIGHTPPAVTPQRGVVSRRDVLRLLATATGATLLAACTAQAPAPAKPTTSAAATGPQVAERTPLPAAVVSTPVASTPIPKSGGILRRGIAGGIVTIWPSFGANSIDTTGAMYDRLLTYDTNLQPVPQLIESWEQDPNL